MLLLLPHQFFSVFTTQKKEEEPTLSLRDVDWVDFRPFYIFNSRRMKIYSFVPIISEWRKKFEGIVSRDFGVLFGFI
jgi:hypothetical protein